MKIILIKYGELTTKKDNRKLFINILYNNIKRALENYNVKIIKNRVRMFIETEDNIDEIVDILKNIFGIHSIVIATRVNTNIEEIEKEVLNIAKDTKFNTFKVETDRADKSFPISSMDFSRRIGALILKNIDNIKVDVHNPEYLLKIEIREDYTYIYHKEIKYSFKESIDKLKSYIQNNKDIRIWTSHYEINSYLLMLYICNYLQNKDCNIYVVFSDEYNKDCYSPTCMNAPELNKLKDLEHKLNKNEINSYSSKLLDIVNENSDIRLLEDNNVKSVSYDYLNDYILIKLKKLGSTKISKLTIEIMKDYHLIDLLVFYLIRRLINENKIIIVTKNEDNSFEDIISIK